MLFSAVNVRLDLTTKHPAANLGDQTRRLEVDNLESHQLMEHARRARSHSWFMSRLGHFAFLVDALWASSWQLPGLKGPNRLRHR